MIELHRVWKVFAVGPVKVPALSDVSFRVAKGEFVTLHGASGAGKTTLLRLLYREELPTEGEAQRAALARAMARNPRLLLADEPTGSLDETMAAEVVDIVKDIWAGGTTVLFATHQARLAAVLRQRTLTLVGGRLVKDEG